MLLLFIPLGMSGNTERIRGSGRVRSDRAGPFFCQRKLYLFSCGKGVLTGEGLWIESQNIYEVRR